MWNSKSYSTFQLKTVSMSLASLRDRSIHFKIGLQCNSKNIWAWRLIFIMSFCFLTLSNIIDCGCIQSLNYGCTWIVRMKSALSVSLLCCNNYILLERCCIYYVALLRQCIYHLYFYFDNVFITLYYYCDIVFIVLLYLLQAMMIGGFSSPPYIPYIITAIGAASYYIDIN